MAKKRSCRRTSDEERLHEKVVKLRKMTDEQLIYYVEDRVAKADSEGFNRGKKAAAPAGMSVADFIEEVKSIKGIGSATLYKIKTYYRERGML